MAKVGRPKAIEKPENMLSLFIEYRKSIKENPVLVQDFVGKDADEVERKKERPLTLDGFENFCFDAGIINDLGDYFSNKNGAYEEFSTICSRIRKIIRQDQIEGGMIGIFNASITQRLNGLADKTETKVEATITDDIDYDQLSDAALEEIARAKRK